jgi:hypothetical protein
MPVLLLLLAPALLLLLLPARPSALMVPLLAPLTGLRLAAAAARAALVPVPAAAEAAAAADAARASAKDTEEDQAAGLGAVLPELPWGARKLVRAREKRGVCARVCVCVRVRVR